MSNREHSSDPVLLPIKNGWSAHGDGWAVHAVTQDEVIQAFYERVAQYQHIDERQYSAPRQEPPPSQEHQ